MPGRSRCPAVPKAWVCSWPTGPIGIGWLADPRCRASAAALAEGALLGAYKFDKYISDTPEKRDLEILVAGVCRRGSVIDAQEAERGLEQGAAVADVTNWVRDIVNEVPQIYTPAAMARDAAELACDVISVYTDVHLDR